jgi:hypothetical protein
MYEFIKNRKFRRGIDCTLIGTAKMELDFTLRDMFKAEEFEGVWDKPRGL